MAYPELTLVRTEEALRSAVTELKDQPTGEVFGAAYLNIAKRKVSALNDLLVDPAIIKKNEVKALQEALEETLRIEGQCKTKCDEWAAKEEATLAELQAAETQEAPNLLASLATLRWKCTFYADREQAKAAGCPGQRPIDSRFADPWRKQRIADLKEELAGVRRERENVKTAYDAAVIETGRRRERLEVLQNAIDNTSRGIERQVGHWEAKEQEAEHYTAAWRSLNALVSGREKRERAIAASAEALRKARERFENRKGRLSTYYAYVLKHIISAAAAGDIEVTGDGIWPRSNNAVADSGTTLRQYADVLGFDLACLVASVAGVGYLPRLWIHDSPRQADSEEQLYHSTLLLLSDLEAKYPAGCGPSFQYILTTTSAAPTLLNHSPYVRLRLHGRSGDGKLLRRDFGK